MNTTTTYAGKTPDAWNTFMTAVTLADPKRLRPEIIALEARIRGINITNPVRQSTESISLERIQEESTIARYMRANEPEPIDLKYFQNVAKEYLNQKNVVRDIVNNFETYALDYMTSANQNDARDAFVETLLKGIHDPKERKEIKSFLAHKTKHLDAAFENGSVEGISAAISNLKQQYSTLCTQLNNQEMIGIISQYALVTPAKDRKGAIPYTSQPRTEIRGIVHLLDHAGDDVASQAQTLQETGQTFLMLRRRAVHAQMQQHITKEALQRKHTVSMTYNDEGRAPSLQTKPIPYGQGNTYYARSTLEKIAESVTDAAKSVGAAFVKGFTSLFRKDSPKAYDGYNRAYA